MKASPKKEEKRKKIQQQVQVASELNEMKEIST